LHLQGPQIGICPWARILSAGGLEETAEAAQHSLKVWRANPDRTLLPFSLTLLWAAEFAALKLKLKEFSEMHFLVSLFLSLALLAGGVPQSAAPAGQAKSPRAWDAKTIEWQEVDADGTKYALLEGHRDVPGEAFTYAFFIPAGYHEHHWHSADARVAVVQGALKVNFGETLDLEHTTAYPVGSFLLVPANVKHTMAADVDTIIIGTAVGPWATHHHGEHQHH